MAYTIKGTYAAVCNCKLLCPCPVDGTPTGEGGTCNGVAVFHVREGNLENTDVSGVTFALLNHFPSNITAGNWRVAIAVDESASDEQAQAVERIVSGQEGGPFGDFVPLIGEYVGMERGTVSLSDGDSPSGSVSGVGDFGVELLRGPDGSATTVRGAMFGFAPEYKVGKGSGRVEVLGQSFDPGYAETADFEYSSEGTEAVHPRA
jgi:hypothetical protein